MISTSDPRKKIKICLRKGCGLCKMKNVTQKKVSWKLSEKLVFRSTSRCNLVIKKTSSGKISFLLVCSQDQKMKGGQEERNKRKEFWINLITPG